MHNRRERGKKGKRERGNQRSVYCLPICRAEEVRGPVISFPDSTLEEGKGLVYLPPLWRREERKREIDRNQIKLYIATAAYVASSILSIART